ncbi:glycosyl hydrolase [Aestuariicella hydrocarbonica]|uniref:Glycosyl hydrolase n=1 Tax=Pseudomaricurvus hydrocarbonicus TaxID=1470433 RepID=A0A9E5JWD1_9GAMM|nr:glycoside hydrolase family 3 C-terminal domain-containing protein [Aestuariicella hydrocarbonica]NHO65786.1 glycosyl hydrolase [Aestuariicella hydrocarbonica]
MNTTRPSSNNALTTQAKQLVEQMTLEEKASLCSGENFWQLKSLPRFKLPALMVTDGPHGLRKQAGDSDHLGMNNSVPATCFPTASALASSWDLELLQTVGEALGRETAAQNVAVLLGPGINIKRHPLGGRNFEYFSEDPLLTGQLAAAMIRGVQSQGVGSCLKHFAVNNQETNRMITDAVVDDRTLRELYLRGFEVAIEQSQPWSVMSAYNRLNGTYCSDNAWLLTQVLRKDWQFEGIVVSDWMASNDRVRSIEAGLNLEMPGNGGVTDQQLIEAVSNGSLTEKELDRCVTGIIELMLKARQRPVLPTEVDLPAHHHLAREAARRSVVLLKNERQTLPLQTGQTIAVIGAFAKQPRFQGCGSSKVNPTQIDAAYDSLASWAEQHPGTRLLYADGYCPKHSPNDEALISDAVEIAQAANIVVLFAGLPESFETETADRSQLSLPQQHQRLIDIVAAVDVPSVVVLSNGSAITMNGLEQVDALLEGYLTGQASGSAIADMLTGASNPSGKLAETFPLRQSDLLADAYFPGSARQVQYREGLYVGYRYFNTVDKAVLFPFGYGLSYSNFRYLKADLQGDPLAEGVRIRVTLHNDSHHDGEEIVQLYVGCQSSNVHRPRQQLAGFAKLLIPAGEKRSVDISLDLHAFDFYCVKQQRWLKNPGQYSIDVGSSSRHLHLQIPVTIPVREPVVSTETIVSTDPVSAFFQAMTAETRQIPDTIFQDMLQRDIPTTEPTRPFTVNSTLTELESSRLGRHIAKAFAEKMLEHTQIDKDDTQLVTIVQNVMKSTPLKSMALASNGQFSLKTLNILIHCLNYRFGQALLTLLRH